MLVKPSSPDLLALCYATTTCAHAALRLGSQSQLQVLEALRQ